MSHHFYSAFDAPDLPSQLIELLSRPLFTYISWYFSMSVGVWGS